VRDRIKPLRAQSSWYSCELPWACPHCEKIASTCCAGDVSVCQRYWSSNHQHYPSGPLYHLLLHYSWIQNIKDLIA